MDFKITIYHLQRRTSDVKFRPSKCWVPYFFDNRGAIVKKFVLQKKILTVKKIPQKSLLQKKNFLLNMNCKNVVKQKKLHKGHITGRQKKKSKLKVWHSFKKKYLKSHFRDPKKRFFQFRILRSVSVCSLYLLQTVV